MPEAYVPGQRRDVPCPSRRACIVALSRPTPPTDMLGCGEGRRAGMDLGHTLRPVAARRSLPGVTLTTVVFWLGLRIMRPGCAVEHTYRRWCTCGGIAG